ncbi:MAG: DNA recombination protein RmuC [Prevotellaceae bacterium]|jgi:DNA recombination protein RmuC|nr:DNA recombination protein RmuC [Prevotellaceae bacterium]
MMNILALIAGLVAGTATAYVIFYLRYKTHTVPKVDFDALYGRCNDLHTKVIVLEEKQLLLQQEHLRVVERLTEKEVENSGLQAKTAALEMTIINKDQRLQELAQTLAEQKKELFAQQQDIMLLRQATAEMNAQNESLKTTCRAQLETVQKQTEQLSNLTDRYQHLTAEYSAMTANHSALNEKLSTQKEEMLEMQRTAQLQFEKIASQILEEKSGKFTELNKANIEALLKPLGENIDHFKKKVEETYDKESKQRFSLEEKVKELVEQTNKVSSEANNLASALKGQAKKQGDWGEMILESILQKSGLERGREYFLQQTIKDDEGHNLRPDVLVKLPDNRIVIIDSKVSLVAYDRFSAADTPEEQQIHLAEHLKSVYAHVDELHAKQYDNLKESLDFTMMFVPIEPAYLIAIQHDPELWAYAYVKRILLLSPTNLIACLKLIADLWKREWQNKNAMDIVRQGELLYEKIVGFVSTLEEIGRHINKSQEAYATAINQLSAGRGNLIKRAIDLKNLGLKSSKTIPPTLLPIDVEAEELEVTNGLPE